MMSDELLQIFITDLSLCCWYEGYNVSYGSSLDLMMKSWHRFWGSIFYAYNDSLLEL